MKTLIVSAADESFFPLLQGLLLSLQQWENRSYTDIAVLDLGLSAGSLAWVRKVAQHIVEPGWDLPVNEASRYANNPHYRAVTARPFLPRYFPGYDIYVWLDADTWVQERFALDACVSAASRGSLAAIPETHAAYHYKSNVVQWRTERMSGYFGEAAAANARWDIFVNSGVFALPAKAPHWSLWAKWLSTGLENARFAWFSDQTALNYAVWAERLPVAYLPARCNWLCHLALPRYDRVRQLFCEPDEMGQVIGILHLAGETKDASLDSITMSKPLSLRYPGLRQGADSSPASDKVSAHRGISF